MNSTKKAARIAGLLYLVVLIPGVFGLIYVPSVLIVFGDAAATAHNIAASETLFRSGIVANLVGQACFIFVAFALYHLLKGVNKKLAVLMVTLIVVSIPIAFGPGSEIICGMLCTVLPSFMIKSRVTHG